MRPPMQSSQMAMQKFWGRLVPWHVFEELRPDPRYQKVAAKPESLGPLGRRQMCPLGD
jgi:hypothetical protein